MTRLRVLHTDQGHDVACLGTIQLFTVIRVHLNDSTNPLSLPCKGVQDAIAFLNSTGIDTREGQRAKSIIHNLERKRSKRLVRINDGVPTRWISLNIDLFLRLDFRRVGQVINDGIQHILDPFVLEC